MIITKNKLFSGILLFGLTTIILVLFNIHYFYLRAIFSFIFLTTVPGLFIMLMLKIRKVGFWEYLVYTVGLSIAFLMFAGLAVNWILPWLHITDKPLALTPLLISFGTILSIIGIIAYIRNKDLSFEIKFPKLDWLNKIFFITPVIFPILSILGAITLNNGGSNYLTMVMLVGIALYAFLIVYFRDKLNGHVFPWSIYLISLSLLLMGWLRSNYASGIDINIEYFIFQLTKTEGVWLMSNYNNAYNACLSLTILPTVISQLTRISDPYVFKLVIPILFALTPVSIFYLAKKYLKKEYAFFAALFFIFEIPYLTWWWIPVRQGIAFIFFSISLLILFNKDIDPKKRNILFIIYSIGMILSHYSTAYMALGIYVLSYFLSKLYNLVCSKKHNNKMFNISGRMIILLLVFSFLWYAQITKSSANLKLYAKDIFQNFKVTVINDLQSPQLGNLLLGFSHKSINYSQELNKYYLNNITKENLANLQSKYPITFLDSKKIPISQLAKSIPVLKNDPSSIMYAININTVKLIEVLVIIGLITISTRKKYKYFSIEYKLFSFACFAGLVCIALLNTTSINYDISRAFQQTAFILAIPVMFGIITVYSIFPPKLRSFLISLLFVYLLLESSGVISQTIGGVNAQATLNNYGYDYDLTYVHKSDVIGAKWLLNNYKQNATIFADAYTARKIQSVSLSTTPLKFSYAVLPYVIDTNSYVFSSYTNIITGGAFITLDRYTVSYNYPIEYLNDNKNLIYNSGSSHIYR